MTYQADTRASTSITRVIQRYRSFAGSILRNPNSHMLDRQLKLERPVPLSTYPEFLNASSA
ncbi:hypothetical protein Mapa_016728 [Marchantia paleacea]|nr:hypothetical protein Mapa_016728 [Marchantia paleacea]